MPDHRNGRTVFELFPAIAAERRLARHARGIARRSDRPLQRADGDPHEEAGHAGGPPERRRLDVPMQHVPVTTETCTEDQEAEEATTFHGDIVTALRALPVIGEAVVGCQLSVVSGVSCQKKLTACSRLPPHDNRQPTTASQQPLYSTPSSPTLPRTWHFRKSPSHRRSSSVWRSVCSSAGSGRSTERP